MTLAPNVLALQNSFIHSFALTPRDELDLEDGYLVARKESSTAPRQ